MQQIAIIGAGELGGALAHLLARRNLASGICLVDETGHVAEGKALDIMQAAPLEGFATKLSGSADLSTAGGAAVVIIADPAEGPALQGGDGLRLLKRLTELAARSVILCAGASHRDLVDSGVRELHIAPGRLFGTAPEALAAGARALVALAMDGSPRDVTLSVLGTPPTRIVIPWQDAAAAGFALTKLLDEPARRRVSTRIAALWPPGPHALASAATKAVEAMSGRTRAVVSCFVAPDDAEGRRTRTSALPVRLGAAGIERIVLPSLSVVDQVALDNAIVL
jgi:malate dehydrogenase